MVLGISNQRESTIRNFIVDQGITFPVLRDDNNVYWLYNLPVAQSPYPRDFIIDQNGIIQFADTEYDPGTMIKLIQSLVEDQSVNVDEHVNILPRELSISTVYPNPFNQTVTIVVENEEGKAVDLEIFDITGRWVNTLYSGWLDAGSHHFKWTSANNHNNAPASGVYFVTLRGDRQKATRRIVLLQ